MPTQKVPILWIMFLVGIAIAVAGILLTSPRGPAKAPGSAGEVDEPRVETFDQMLRVGKNAVYVDVQPAGAEEVLVGFAVMEHPGYVVIYDDAAGLPGKVIGRSELLASGGEHLFVAVDKPLANQQVYYAMLVLDDGDGVYNEVLDGPVVDGERNTILMSFEALTGADPETGPIAF